MPPRSLPAAALLPPPRRPLGPPLLSRRRWLLWVGASLAVLPVVHRQLRRRQPGQPGPVGWFGHC